MKRSESFLLFPSGPFKSSRTRHLAVRHAKLACFHILEPTFGLFLHSKF